MEMFISFFSGKVMLFYGITLIMKEKSNASALRYDLILFPSLTFLYNIIIHFGRKNRKKSVHFLFFLKHKDRYFPDKQGKRRTGEAKGSNGQTFSIFATCNTKSGLALSLAACLQIAYWDGWSLQSMKFSEIPVL